MAARSPSQLFHPFQAIGFCCNHIPLAAFTRGSGSVVVTAVGHSFHVYRVTFTDIAYLTLARQLMLSIGVLPKCEVHVVASFLHTYMYTVRQTKSFVCW